MAKHARTGARWHLLAAIILGLVLWFPLGLVAGSYLQPFGPQPHAAVTAPHRPSPSPSASVRPPHRHPVHQARHYVVRPGDSLWSIARAKYGRGSLWLKLWKLNPQVLTPGVIHAGDVLNF